MKKMLKTLKWVAIGALALLALLLLLKWALDKPLPQGKAGTEAEQLAQKMLKAINHESWLKTEAIEWNFDGRHKLLWDKKRHLARVTWDKYQAFINCATQKGYIIENGKRIENLKTQNKLLEKAYFIWANDSYWLNPISKMYDDGVERSLVELEDGKNALLVEYTTGGVTPGDQYLWYVNENGLPYKWEMWVKIVPIKGFTASWEAWKISETAVAYATVHTLGPLAIEITEVKMAFNLLELTNGVDVFYELE